MRLYYRSSSRQDHLSANVPSTLVVDPELAMVRRTDGNQWLKNWSSSIPELTNRRDSTARTRALSRRRRRRRQPPPLCFDNILRCVHRCKRRRLQVHRTPTFILGCLRGGHERVDF